MKILAFESSCDETAVAVVEDGRRVLSDAIASQADLHALYGGVVPEIELSSRQLLVTLAEIGLGVAGVTLEFVHKELESGGIRLLKTDFDIPERSVDMCTLREVHPTAAAAAFMEMVRRGG